MKIINIDWTIDDEDEDIILPLTMDIPEKSQKKYWMTVILTH